MRPPQLTEDPGGQLSLRGPKKKKDTHRKPVGSRSGHKIVTIKHGFLHYMCMQPPFPHIDHPADARSRRSTIPDRHGDDASLAGITAALALQGNIAGRRLHSTHAYAHTHSHLGTLGHEKIVVDATSESAN